MPSIALKININKKQLKKIINDLGIIKKSVGSLTLFSKIFARTKVFVQKNILSNFLRKRNKGGGSWPAYKASYKALKNRLFRKRASIFTSFVFGYKPVKYSASSVNKGKLTGTLLSQLELKKAFGVDTGRRAGGFKATYDFKPYSKFQKKSGNYLNFFINSGRNFMFLSRPQQKQITDYIMGEYVLSLLNQLK